MFESTIPGPERAIWVMDSDGGNLTQVTDQTEEQPCFSPDGTELVFRSDRDGNGEIYRSDLAGGNLVRLTNETEFDGGPDWR